MNVYENNNISISIEKVKVVVKGDGCNKNAS